MLDVDHVSLEWLLLVQLMMMMCFWGYSSDYILHLIICLLLTDAKFIVAYHTCFSIGHKVAMHR